MQDAEPDENGAPGRIYRAIPDDIIPTPRKDAFDYPRGTRVLARNPETTYFSPAIIRHSLKSEGVYDLVFDEYINSPYGQYAQVDARFVLDFNLLKRYVFPVLGGLSPAEYPLKRSTAGFQK